MCVGMHAAEFLKTIIMMYLKSDGTHVFGYQNMFANSHDGANAMILHIKANSIGPENFIDTTDFSNILKDMVDAVNPVMRGDTFSKGSPTLGAQVFDVGIYTIVVASNASDMVNALDRVPINKRPNPNDLVIDFYKREIDPKGYIYVLCCFDGRAESQPILMHYEPSERTFRFPGLDEHFGRAPQLGVSVEVDHWLIAGLETFSQPWDKQKFKDVLYKDNIPSNVMK